MHGNVEHGEDVVYTAWGEHKAGVHGAAHNSPQGVPRPLIKPVEEVVVAIFDHVRRGSVVEPVRDERYC